MKKIMLAFAIVCISINFFSCTPENNLVEQDEVATQGEQEGSEVDPHDED